MTLWGRVFYFSTNTQAAFAISEGYYRNRHFVWCSPDFDVPPTPGAPYQVAPSSCPKRLYWRYLDEMMDTHSTLYRDNKRGIKKGAAAQRKAGVIDDAQYREIVESLRRLTPMHFRPMLYIIPESVVKSRVVTVAPRGRANVGVPEYQIPDLHRSEFTYIYLER